MKKFGLFLIIVFVLFCKAVYCADIVAPADLGMAETYYKQGKDSLRKGDYISANESFKKAEALLGSSGPLDIDIVAPLPVSLPQPVVENIIPGKEPTLNELTVAGQEAYAAGNYAEAVYSYKQIIKMFPKNVSALYNLALSYVGMGDYSAAASTLEDLLKLQPKDLDARYNLGIIYESYLGDIEHAVLHYKKFLMYCGNSPQALQVQEWLDYVQRQAH